MSGEIKNLNSGNPHKGFSRRTRTTFAVRHNSYTNRKQAEKPASQIAHLFFSKRKPTLKNQKSLFFCQRSDGITNRKM